VRLRSEHHAGGFDERPAFQKMQFQFLEAAVLEAKASMN
jgi:hypothetical protein